MVNESSLQALFGLGAAHVLHGYVLGGGVAVVYALTWKQARVLETCMLYGWSWAGLRC